MTELLDSLINFEMNDFFTLGLRAVFGYVFVLLVAIVIWVARDVVARSKNLIFQVFAILLVIILNLPGLLIYLIIRPQKTLLEKYHEELEQKILAEHDEFCPKCDKNLPLEFQFCPHCGDEAREKCKKCDKLVSKNWSTCPYCGSKRLVEKNNSEKKSAKK